MIENTIKESIGKGIYREGRMIKLTGKGKYKEIKKL